MILACLAMLFFFMSEFGMLGRGSLFGMGGMGGGYGMGWYG